MKRLNNRVIDIFLRFRSETKQDDGSTCTDLGNGDVE